MPDSSKKKILIVHFRVGRTDGVSLEIASWKHILQKLGHVVKLASGPVNNDADYIIEDLEHQLNPIVYDIDEQVYGRCELFSEFDLKKRIEKLQTSISKDFNNTINYLKPDRIIISNIFSVGKHIGAAKALLQVLDEHKIRTLLVHHDLYWEICRYEKPVYMFVEKLIKENFVPVRDYIFHACINSIAQEELEKRKGIKADIFYDTLDFEQESWSIDKYNKDILEDWKIKPDDIVILQATRIVRRKNIELAIDFVNRLQKVFNDFEKKKIKLYNGQVFEKDKSKIYLVLAGYAEKEDENYFKELNHYAVKNRTHLCYIGDSVNNRRYFGTINKKYSLWDAYAMADIITYPSGYEGFGNQFLEAIFAKKPVAVFEYPVFITDIKNKGFRYISLGSKLFSEVETKMVKVQKGVMTRAAKKVYEVLTNADMYSDIVNENFDLGKRNFSLDKAEEKLVELLNL